jgi:hypothetical protein
MAITENEINELNNFLEMEDFDIERFEKFYRFINYNYTIKIELIDCEYYNERRLEEIIKEKIIGVELWNFEWAAYNRDLELGCQKYIALKSQFNIEKSVFHYKQNLMYFYFGTAKNDKFVRSFLQKMS